MKVSICGNSHTAALFDAARATHDPLAKDIFSFGGTMWERVDFSAVRDGQVWFVEKEHAANFVSREDFAFSKDCLWGVVSGTHCARLYAEPYWLTAAPSDRARPDQQPLSEGLITRMIEADQANVRAFLKRMHDTSTPCFVISCPPPRRDHPIISNGADQAAILHLDHRARASFRAFIDQLDIDFIEPPPESFGDDGFLREDLELRVSKVVKRDYLHANESYGAMMLPRIHAYLDARLGANSEKKVTRR